MNDKIRELGCLLSDLVAIVSQLWVTVYALRSGSSGKDTASFVLLFTFPVLVEIWGENRPDYAVVSFKSRGDDEMIIRKMKDTASDREEAVVMGMQDYILRRWEEATLKYNEGREDDEEVGYDRGGRSLTVTTALQNFVWVRMRRFSFLTTGPARHKSHHDVEFARYSYLASRCHYGSLKPYIVCRQISTVYYGPNHLPGRVRWHDRRAGQAPAPGGSRL